MLNKRPVDIYLFIYNATALLFWIAFAFYFIINSFNLDKSALILLNIAQGVAFLEILHSIFKIISSSVFVTAPQISSRLFVVFLLNYFFFKNNVNVITEIGIKIVAFAWSITEIIRYTHYLLSLVNKQIKAITFLRYSTFIILYPLGIIGEWCILITPFYQNQISFTFYTIVVLITVLLYIIFFPKLYGHLWKQRKIKLI